MEVNMDRSLEILLSSYIDGECSNPEIVEDILMKNKEAKEIYADLLTSKKIEKLEYQKCPIPFDKIVILDKRRESFKQILVTVGAVAMAIFFLFPLIKNSYQVQQLKNKILTEVLR
jgi:hypothetical protein